MSELQRGANIPLTKENPNLQILTIGVSWAANDQKLKEEVQMGAVLLKDGKALSGEQIIFFNQLNTADNTVNMGNDLQQIDVNLSGVPQEVTSIEVLLWVNQSNRRLKQLTKIQARALDATQGKELVKTEDFSKHLTEETALCLVSLYRHNGDWKLRAKGEGWSNGMEGAVKTYGIE